MGRPNLSVFLFPVGSPITALPLQIAHIHLTHMPTGKEPSHQKTWVYSRTPGPSTHPTPGTAHTLEK